MATAGEITRIRELLERVFEGEAWHGPPILSALSEIEADVAFTRPAVGGASICEIANHVTAWLTIVRRRAEGETVSEVDSTMDWPPCESEAPRAWDETRERLRASYVALSSSLAELDDDRLDDRVQGKLREYSVYDDLHGVIQHSLYHVGQIALLAKRRG